MDGGDEKREEQTFSPLSLELGLSMMYLICPWMFSVQEASQVTELSCCTFFHLWPSGALGTLLSLLQLMMTSSGWILLLIMPCFGCSPRPRNSEGGSVLGRGEGSGVVRVSRSQVQSGGARGSPGAREGSGGGRDWLGVRGGFEGVRVFGVRGWQESVEGQWLAGVSWGSGENSGESGRCG